MAEFDSSLRSGTTLYHGTYRIERVIGRGGFGITYMAVNTQLGTTVAIKEFFPKGMLNRDGDTTEASIASHETGELTNKLKAKFVKEARRIASLNHESIVRVTGAFEENGTAYYVMDFIEGRDLHSLVKQEGPLPLNRAVEYVEQIGKALEYLHSLRINHLDVKPANILIDPKTDKAVLIDFGLSKQYDNGGHQTSTTPVGVSEGYAPIEQYKSGGVQEFSAPTDVYSLAATLYYLLTGQRPPSSNDLVEDELRFPSNIPAYLQTAITRAMSTRRSDRYPTVAAFLSAIKTPSPSATYASPEPEATRVVTPLADTEQTRIYSDSPSDPAPELDEDEYEEGSKKKLSKKAIALLVLSFFVFILFFIFLAYGFFCYTASLFDTDVFIGGLVFVSVILIFLLGLGIFLKKKNSTCRFFVWLSGIWATLGYVFIYTSYLFVGLELDSLNYSNNLGTYYWEYPYLSYYDKWGDLICYGTIHDTWDVDGNSAFPSARIVYFEKTGDGLIYYIYTENGYALSSTHHSISYDKVDKLLSSIKGQLLTPSAIDERIAEIEAASVPN